MGTADRLKAPRPNPAPERERRRVGSRRARTAPSAPPAAARRGAVLPQASDADAAGPAPPPRRAPPRGLGYEFWPPRLRAGSFMRSYPRKASRPEARPQSPRWSSPPPLGMAGWAPPPSSPARCRVLPPGPGLECCSGNPAEKAARWACGRVPPGISSPSRAANVGQPRGAGTRHDAASPMFTHRDTASAKYPLLTGRARSRASALGSLRGSASFVFSVAGRALPTG